MLLLNLNSTTTELLAKIAAAEVARIDDELYIITRKSEITEPSKQILHSKIEDHEIIFETEFHIFNWWELNCDITKLNDSEWKIGNNIVCFLTIVPV